MPGNSATVSIAIEVDDKGSVKIRQLGEAARKAGDEGARGFEQMGKSASGAERGINTMSTSLKALGGLAAAVAASAIVQQIAQIGGAAIKAASDMEETQGKFNVVFQGMTAQAEAWAGELRASFNMSSLEAKRFLGDIQNMLVPAGLMREEAGKMSFELTKLAADLGSFNNLPTEQVFRDIMSALQGSTETMDKYGINVRSTLVEQEALNMGLAATKDELTHADRLTATYSLIVKQAGDAIGDTARTSGSYANQLKQLNANLEEVRITIGQALLPTVNDMVSGVNDWFRENEGVLKQDIKTWAEIAAGGLRALLTVVQTVAEAYRKLKEVIVAVGTAEMDGGFAMMAEAAAQGVDKLVSNINRVPGALANIKQAEEEIARIQGNIAKQGFASEQQTAGVARLKGEIEGYRAKIAAAEAPTTNTAAAVKVLDGSSKTAVASTTKLGQAATDTAKALDTKSASSRTAAKSAEDMAREDERIGRQMLADHATRVKATQELTDNLNEHARQGAEEKRIALGEQLRLEYADEAANVDDKMKLEQDHADWVRGLQEGLLRDIEGGIGDFVYDFLTGEFDSISDLFDDLCSSILRAFASLITEMVAKWAMSGLVGLFTGQGFGGFNMAAMGLGPGGVLGSGAGAAGSWLGAAGYQPGAGGGWTSYAGPALATAGGAYALYDAASKASKGEMNAGTAIEAAGGAYLAYTGGSALLGKLGGAAAAPIIQDMVVPASSEIIITASDLTLLGPQTGGIGNAIAGGGTQSGGLMGMGATATAFTGFGAFVAGLGALAAAGATPWQSITSPTLGIGVDMPIHGGYGESDARRRASTLLDIESGLYDPTAGGGGDTIGMGSLAEFDLKPIIEDARGLLDILANQWGDGLAKLALDLDGSVAATDRMVDAAAGYDVSLQTSAELTRLASEAVGGSSTAMESLRATLQSLGLSEEQTETAMLGLIAATGSTTGKVQTLAAVLQSQGMSAADAQATAQALVSAMQSQQTAASGAASAISGMVSNIRTLSNTPLNIKVGVSTYKIDNSNPYAEHATGGIFASPTLIPSITGRRHLVGESGAEAILPLHAGPRTLQQMDAKLDALLSGGRPVQHVINLDGRQIASATLPYVDAHVAGKASRGALTKRTVF